MVHLLVMVWNKENCGHGWLMFGQEEIKISEVSSSRAEWQRSSGLGENTG